MRRALLDTNVIVSGLIAGTGAPRRILEAWRRREFDLVISPMILEEVARVLALPRIARRYRLTPQDAAEVSRLLRTRALLVTTLPPIPPTARDPADDHVLAAAQAGHADCIVSGDGDLLALGRHAGLPILSPAAFAALLDAER